MGVRGRLTLALTKPAYEYGRGAVEAQRMVASGVHDLKVGILRFSFFGARF